MKPFLRVSNSSTLFTSAAGGPIFANFLQDLMDPRRYAAVDAFLNLVFAHRESKSLNPSLQMQIWVGGMTVLLNESDVTLMINVMAEMGDELASSFHLKGGDLSTEPTPVTFELWAAFPDSKTSPAMVNFDLFGAAPPTVPELTFGNGEEHARRWRSLAFLAQQRAVSSSEFALSHFDKFDPEFQAYAASQILLSYKANYESVGSRILMAEQLTQFNDYMESIAKHNTDLYHCFSSDFFSRIAQQKLRLVDALTPVLSGLDAPGQVAFEIGCIALDCIPFAHSVLVRDKPDRFAALLSHWADTMWPQVKDRPGVKAKVPYVMSAGLIFDQMIRYRLGRVLKMILEFQRNLLVIMGGDYSPGWEILFHYAMFVGERPEILKVFLWFHHYIFLSPQVVASWGKTVHQLWERFATGMWFVLKADTAFCSFCSNLKTCAPHIGRDPNYVPKADPKKKK
jgi:hypothetical protein